TRRHTQRPRRKRRHAPRRASPGISRGPHFRIRLHPRLRRRHRCFRQLHRKLRTIFLSCRPRRFPLRFLFSVAPRHFPKRFLSRRTLAGSLRLLLFLLARIILARRNFGLILWCEDPRPLQIVFGINVVGTLRLRSLARLLLPRRFGRILRVQCTRTCQPRQQKCHSAEEERSSTSFQGARYNCVRPHRLALARVVLHIHRGDMAGLLGEIVPFSPAPGNRTFSLRLPRTGGLNPFTLSLSCLCAPWVLPSVTGDPLYGLPCGTVTPDCALGFAFVGVVHRSTPSRQGVVTCHPVCPQRSRRDRSAAPFAARSGGICSFTLSLFHSFTLSLFHSFTLAFLCALCVLPSVTGACPDLVGVLPSLFSSHQIRQYFARTIFCPSLHPNASRNSGKFDTTLFTRYFG